MKRLACLVLTAVVAALSCVAASAQKQQKQAASARPALSESATLEETLSWLDSELKQFGKFTVYSPLYEPGSRIKYEFLGLEGQGCSVSYHLGYTALGQPDVYSPYARPFAPRAAARPAAVEEGSIDLSALDPALVEGKTPKDWDGGVVTFSAGRGKVAVKTRSHKRAKLYESSDGRFYVGDGARVKPIADALRRAVELCRK